MRSGFLYRICLKAHRLSKIGYMITKNTLNEMKNADLQTCNKEELVDIRDVQVDTNKNQLERLISFMNAIKNPYLFKVGDVAVKIKFAENEQSFQKKMENIISAKMAL